MKKLLTLCVLVLASLSLASCIKKPQTINVTVNNNTLELTKGETLASITPPREELLTLDYWLVNGEKKDNTYTLQPGDKITSVMREKKFFRVKFENTITKIDDQIIREDMLVQKPNDPIKKFYVFDAWKLNDQIFDFTTPITSDITLVASFKEIGYPKVTVKLLDDGIEKEYSGYLAGDLPKGQDSEKGPFLYWVKNGNKLDPSYELKADDVFTPMYGKWEVKVYYPVFKKEVLTDNEALTNYDIMEERYWVKSLQSNYLATFNYQEHDYIPYLKIPKGYKLFIAFKTEKGTGNDFLINPKVINGVTYSELDNNTKAVTLCLVEE